MNEHAAPLPGRQLRKVRTRALLDHYATGDADDLLRLGDLLTGLGRRAFGVLLLLAIPTALIPGVAGVISSPIVILVGLQLMAIRRRVWLPRFLSQRGPHRHAIVRFRGWFGPWLARLERVLQPRFPLLLDRWWASAITGVLLLMLGILLWLPIPFTNAVFAGFLLLFALALLERDGALMAVAWLSAAAACIVTGMLSGTLAQLVWRWSDVLF